MLVFEQYTSFVCRGPNVRLKNRRFTFHNKRNYIYDDYRIQIGNPPQVHPKTRAYFQKPLEATWPQPVSLPNSSSESAASDHWLLTTAVLGGRAYSALPCAGAPPPQRPRSYNMPRRPGVYIRDGCLPERGSPHYVPSAPSVPCRGRPCACPRTPVQSFPTCLLKCPVGAGLVPALSLPKTSVKQTQQSLASISRQTIPTPILWCTLADPEPMRKPSPALYLLYLRQ